jgi:hypothetical protein
MTERNTEVVEEEMCAVRDRLLDRRFIYGPLWNAVVVSFSVEPDIDYSDEQRLKNFKEFLEGNHKGIVNPVVQALDSMEREVTLTNALMKKIHQVSMEILDDEAEELRKLRAELVYLGKTSESDGPFGYFVGKL